MKHKFAFKMTLWWLIVLLMLERFVLRRVMEKTPSPIRWAVTFLLVLVGWVLFYYTDFSLVLEHLAAMFGFAKTAEGFVRAAWIDAAAATVLRKYTVYPLLAFLCAMPILPAVKKVIGNGRRERLCNALSTLLLTALMALSLLFLIGQSYNPFIYFRF